MRPGEMFLRRKVKAVHDERLIRIEIYNPNEFSVLVERDKRFDHVVKAANIPLGPEKAVVKPGDFLILPHQFVTYHAMNGSPTLNLVSNIGDSIGKGNKLPSPPIFEGRNTNFKD